MCEKLNLDDPRTQALLVAGARMMEGAPGGRKNFAADVGHGVTGGLQAYQGGRAMNARLGEEDQQKQMRELTMNQMRAAQEKQQRMQALGERAFAPGQAPMVRGDDEGNAMPNVGQGGGMAEYLRGMMREDPREAIAMQSQVASLQPKPKMQFAPNGQAVDMNAVTHGQNFAKPPDWKDPEYEAVQARIRAAGRPQVTTNIMPPREIFKDSMALKKDFDAQPEVKGFKEVQGAWDQISTALKDPSAANDLAAATKFMKLLDPGSVVRESELVMAMQASGALDRFANYGNRLMKGEKLTPRQREDFYSAGQALYGASKNRFGETVTQYEGIAKQYGLDAQFIPKSKAPEEKKVIKMGGRDVEASKAKDGKWYVKSGNKFYEVQD